MPAATEESASSAAIEGTSSGAPTTTEPTATGPGEGTTAPTGGALTGTDSGDSTAGPDAPPAIRSFTVNGSTKPPEVGDAGFVALSVVAEDDVGVQEVRFLDGDALLGTVSGPGPHALEWRVDSLLNGLHHLNAVAVDTAMQATGSEQVDLNIFIFGGQEVWSRELEVLDGGVYQVEVDESGEVLIALVAGPDDQTNIEVRKYTPDGDPVWTGTPDAVPDPTLYGLAVADGAAYITRSAAPGQIELVKFDAVGQPAWYVADQVGIWPGSLASSPLGDVVLAGQVEGTGVVVKRYSDRGNLVSETDGPKGSVFGMLAVDATGSFYAAMRVGDDLLVRRYAPGGELTWTRVLEENTNDYPLGVVINAVQESVGVRGFELGVDGLFGQVQMDGTVLHPMDYVGANVMAADASGGWVACGPLQDAPKATVIRYDDEFAPVWEFLTDAESCSDVAVDDAGYIYAVGSLPPATGVVRKLVP